MLVSNGRMAKLVDALVLGTSGETHGGSSPLPPIFYESNSTYNVAFILRYLKYAAVIQLARMPPCQGGCRGFESHPPLS